jgi:hypothetical protein
VRLNHQLPGVTLEALGFGVPLTLAQEALLVEEVNELVAEHNVQLEVAARRDG